MIGLFLSFIGGIVLGLLIVLPFWLLIRGLIWLRIPTPEKPKPDPAYDPENYYK